MCQARFVHVYGWCVFRYRMYLNQFTSKSIQIYTACIFCMHKYVYTQIYVCTKPKLKKVVSVATHHSFDYNFDDVEIFFFCWLDGSAIESASTCSHKIHCKYTIIKNTSLKNQNLHKVKKNDRSRHSFGKLLQFLTHIFINSSCMIDLPCLFISS